jgi:hypothetical protein
MVNPFRWIIGIGLCLLLLGTPAFAVSPGNLSLGVYGGWAWGIADEAIEGRSNYEFDDGPVYGANLLYRFPGDWRWVSASST